MLRSKSISSSEATFRTNENKKEKRNLQQFFLFLLKHYFIFWPFVVKNKREIALEVEDK